MMYLPPEPGLLTRLARLGVRAGTAAAQSQFARNAVAVGLSGTRYAATHPGQMFRWGTTAAMAGNTVRNTGIFSGIGNLFSSPTPLPLSQRAMNFGNGLLGTNNYNGRVSIFNGTGRLAQAESYMLRPTGLGNIKAFGIGDKITQLAKAPKGNIFQQILGKSPKPTFVNKLAGSALKIGRGVPILGGLFGGISEAMGEMSDKQMANAQGVKGKSLFRSITSIVGGVADGAIKAVGATALGLALGGPVGLAAGLAFGVLCPNIMTSVGDTVGALAEGFTGYNANALTPEGEAYYASMQNIYAVPQAQTGMTDGLGLNDPAIAAQVNAIMNGYA